MKNTTGLDYMKILKSVAKVEDDKYEYMVSADDAIEAMKLAVEESHKWISVDDRLPEKGERVIAFCPQIGVLSMALHLNVNNKWKYTAMDVFVMGSHLITHWMPLPHPPTPETLT